MSSGSLYAVIGDPIAHSHSPLIHNTLFRHLQESHQYIALRVRSEAVRQAQMLLADNALGWNVTIPHKQVVIEDLADCSEQARIYGVVNTVKNEQGVLRGFNTDGIGFLRGLGSAVERLAGKRVLVVGAGGSSRAVVYELLRSGCEVTLVNRTLARAEVLAEALPDSLRSSLRIRTLAELKPQPWFLVVNTTPVGMVSHDPNAMPVTIDHLQDVEVVYDLIYNPWQTPLLAAAAQCGATVINGWPMLFHQAMASQAIWRGEDLPEDLIHAVYDEVTTKVRLSSQTL